MSEAEKEERRNQMLARASELQENRKKFIKREDEERDRGHHGEKDERRKDARFLKDMKRDVFAGDSEMGLSERLNRKAHYRDRGSNRD